MTAPTATVVLCRCGHAERRHSDEDGCSNQECGCAEFRPFDSARSPAPVVTSPAAGDERTRTDVPVPAPAAVTSPAAGASRNPSPAPAAARPDTQYECPEPGCGETFERPQGLGAHRRYKHGGATKLPAAAEQGSPSQDGSSAAVPSVRPDETERLSVSGTATTGEDPAPAGEDAPTTGVGLIAEYSAFVRVHLANELGVVEMRLADASRDEFASFLDVVNGFVRTARAAAPA